MSKLRDHPKWTAVRESIKAELVDDNMEYPEGWSGGWLVPGSDSAADAMLDDITEVALRAALAEPAKQP
jgi:hypothetical protein